MHGIFVSLEVCKVFYIYESIEDQVGVGGQNVPTGVNVFRITTDFDQN